MPLERSPFGSSAQPATAVPVTYLPVETCGRLAGLFQACLLMAGHGPCALCCHLCRWPWGRLFRWGRGSSH